MEKVIKLQKLNKKIILEVKILRVENGTLKKANGEVSNKSKELEGQHERIEAEKCITLKELEDLAMVSKEFEDEIGRKSRTMQREIVQKAKALEEAKGALSKKEEEVEALQVKQRQRPQSSSKGSSSKGSSSNSNIFCYLCSRIEHFRLKITSQINIGKLEVLGIGGLNKFG